MALTRHLVKVVKELGLLPVLKSPRDTKLLIVQRFIRFFAYGGSTLILALYLQALNISQEKIGLFMTLTLWGDVIISFSLTLYADALGRKAILAAGAVLMTGSGVVFALSGNYWVLLAAAILGVISPSGNEIGPFRAIEESTLAQLSAKEVRADILTWYILCGSAGTAVGMLTCGWIVSHLLTLDGWDVIRAYRIVFFGYALCGLIKLCLALGLSHKIEAIQEAVTTEQSDPERAPILAREPRPAVEEPKPRGLFSKLFPHISEESKVILAQLVLLFALDSFASGLVPLSWITQFFETKFDMSSGLLGTLFSGMNIILAISALIAASLARRFGNIKTMVFTHLPSAIFLALIPVPGNLPLAATFLILRACTQSMDTAPRSAFIAAVVLPNERTAVMGVINVAKTCAQSVGPTVTGILFSQKLYWIVFVLAGSLKASYDLGILAVFSNHVAREDRVSPGVQRDEARDEEGY